MDPAANTSIQPSKYSEPPRPPRSQSPASSNRSVSTIHSGTSNNSDTHDVFDDLSKHYYKRTHPNDDSMQMPWLNAFQGSHEKDKDLEPRTKMERLAMQANPDIDFDIYDDSFVGGGNETNKADRDFFGPRSEDSVKMEITASLHGDDKDQDSKEPSETKSNPSQASNASSSRSEGIPRQQNNQANHERKPRMSDDTRQLLERVRRSPGATGVSESQRGQRSQINDERKPSSFEDPKPAPSTTPAPTPSPLNYGPPFNQAPSNTPASTPMPPMKGPPFNQAPLNTPAPAPSPLNYGPPFNQAPSNTPASTPMPPMNSLPEKPASDPRFVELKSQHDASSETNVAENGGSRASSYPTRPVARRPSLSRQQSGEYDEKLRRRDGSRSQGTEFRTNSEQGHPRQFLPLFTPQPSDHEQQGNLLSGSMPSDHGRISWTAEPNSARSSLPSKPVEVSKGSQLQSKPVSRTIDREPVSSSEEEGKDITEETGAPTGTAGYLDRFQGDQPNDRKTQPESQGNYPKGTPGFQETLTTTQQVERKPTGDQVHEESGVPTDNVGIPALYKQGSKVNEGQQGSNPDLQGKGQEGTQAVEPQSQPEKRGWLPQSGARSEGNNGGDSVNGTVASSRGSVHSLPERPHPSQLASNQSHERGSKSLQVPGLPAIPSQGVSTQESTSQQAISTTSTSMTTAVATNQEPGTVTPSTLSVPVSNSPQSSPVAPTTQPKGQPMTGQTTDGSSQDMPSSPVSEHAVTTNMLAATTSAMLIPENGKPMLSSSSLASNTEVSTPEFTPQQTISAPSNPITTTATTAIPTETTSAMLIPENGNPMQPSSSLASTPEASTLEPTSYQVTSTVAAPITQQTGPVTSAMDIQAQKREQYARSAFYRDETPLPEKEVLKPAHASHYMYHLGGGGDPNPLDHDLHQGTLNSMESKEELTPEQQQPQPWKEFIDRGMLPIAGTSALLLHTQFITYADKETQEKHRSQWLLALRNRVYNGPFLSRPLPRTTNNELDNAAVDFLVSELLQALKKLEDDDKVKKIFNAWMKAQNRYVLCYEDAMTLSQKLWAKYFEPYRFQQSQGISTYGTF